MEKDGDCLLNDRGRKVARLFKRRPGGRWRIALKRPSGKWTERVACRGKPESLRYMAELVDEVAEAERNRSDPFRQHRDTPLDSHIQDYIKSLKDLDRSERHVRITELRINRLVKACDFKVLGDLDPNKVADCLARWRRDGMGTETSNGYITAVKMLETWAVNNQRIPSRRLTVLKRMKNKNPKHPRRALSRKELSDLFEAARKSDHVIHGFDGPSRSLLYRFAVAVGARAAELSQLRPMDFKDADGRMTVTIRASISKNSAMAILPVKTDVAESMRPLLERTPRGSRIWPGRWVTDAAELVRVDLAAAGIAYRDESGRYFDFHSLRGQLATNLYRSNAHVKTTQTMMRHSSPALTLGFYTHTVIEDLEKAMEKIDPEPVQTSTRKEAG